MTEHPLIYSTEMVRAYLAGLKTMTRRVIKPQPKGKRVAWMQASNGTFIYDDWDGSSGIQSRAKYQVDDRLWVKETWATYACMNRWKPSLLLEGEFVVYKASHEFPHQFVWRPSIFMPRWVSRLNQPITSVRVERLLDISEKDAIAEGFENVAQFLAYFDFLNNKRGFGIKNNSWLWVLGYPAYEKRDS